MIALQYARFGEPVDVIAPVDVPVADPGPGEVRLRVLRSPIHNHDLATIRGVYGVKPTFPAVGGSECAAVVDAVGAGVTNVANNDRVTCAARASWAQYTLVPAVGALKVPDAISDDVACQLIAMPISALVLIDELHLNPGEWFVQNAASGAVGTIVMREAQRRGINVINLVRSSEAAERIKAMGARHVVVTDDASWPTRVREMAANAPIRRAVDSVGGPQSMQLQRLLGKGGEMIVFGALDAQAIKLDPGSMISNELTVRGFWMYPWMQRPENAHRAAAATKRVFELASAGELLLPVAHTYPLSACTDALIEAEKSGRNGKVLFAP